MNRGTPILGNLHMERLIDFGQHGAKRRRLEHLLGSESLGQCWNKSSMFRVGGVVRSFTSCMHREQLKTPIHWPSFQFTHFNLCTSLSRIFASIHASNPRHKSTKQNYNKTRRICITQNRFRKKHMKRWNSSLFFPCFVVLKTCLYDLVSWMVQNAVPPTSDRPAEAVGSLESQDDWDAFAVASAPPGFDHLQLNFWGKDLYYYILEIPISTSKRPLYIYIYLATFDIVVIHIWRLTSLNGSIWKNAENFGSSDKKSKW